jgi:hypothetical protein
VLNVIGQLIAVQGADSPWTISVVHVNGDLPTGLAPGKTVIIRGDLKKGLFDTDHITITGGTPWASPVTPPRTLGPIKHMIFFIVRRKRLK